MRSLMPKVGIVTVNYNGKSYIVDFVKSIRQLTYPNFDLCLIDNASTDGSVEELLSAYPDISIVRLPRNVGIAAGNNIGIAYFREQSRVDYILFLNPDTVHRPNFLDEMVKLANARTIVAPRIYFFDRPQIINSMMGEFDWWRGIVKAPHYNLPDSDQTEKVHEVGVAFTCALLVPMSVFDHIGIMDEIYFMYFDDTDFVARAVKQGFVIKYNPDAVIYHKESSSEARSTSPLATYYNNRNRLYFMFKHQHNRLKLSFFLVYYLAGRYVNTIRYLLRGQKKLLFSMFCGVSDFLRGRMGYTSPNRWR